MLQLLKVEARVRTSHGRRSRLCKLAASVCFSQNVGLWCNNCPNRAPSDSAGVVFVRNCIRSAKDFFRRKPDVHEP